MRGTAKILTLLAVTCALWLGLNGSSFPKRGDVERADVESRSASASASEIRRGASVESGPAQRSSRTRQRALARSNGPTPAQDSGSTTPPDDSTPAAPHRSGQPLDDASESEIRLTLTRAVARARTSRALFVSPSVIETAASEGRVGIVFNTGSHPATGAEAITTLLSGHDATGRWDALRLFPLLEHGAARVGPQALLHLIESHGIARIELDAVHRPGLAASVPQIRADLAQQAGADGEQTVVAILDTGIDPDHPMLADRILDEACFSLNKSCPNGEKEMFGPGAGVPCDFGCGHGTAVAGVAAGNDSSGGLRGVAPQASLISIQIFSNVDGAPGAYASDILAGLQHVLSLAAFYEIAAVNLSFGSTTLYTSEEECDASVASQRAAIALLRDTGVATVAAAGNEFTTNALTSPACLSNVLSVGSSSSSDAPSLFSNSASFLSLLAPGEKIESSRSGGGIGTMTGTSIATPHVAGAIAALREAAPAATVEAIENALRLTGEPVLDTRNGVTTPRIDVEAARTLLTGSEADDAPAPEAADESGAAPVSPSASGEDSPSSGGGSSCGLIGIEPFAVLLFLQISQRRHSLRRRRSHART